MFQQIRNCLLSPELACFCREFAFLLFFFAPLEKLLPAETKAICQFFVTTVLSRRKWLRELLKDFECNLLFLHLFVFIYVLFFEAPRCIPSPLHPAMLFFTTVLKMPFSLDFVKDFVISFSCHFFMSFLVSDFDHNFLDVQPSPQSISTPPLTTNQTTSYLPPP